GDTPGRPARDRLATRDQPRREGGEGADLRRPGIGGGGGERAGRDRPRAKQGRDGGDASVGQHLPRRALRRAPLGQLGEEATGEEKDEEQRHAAPRKTPRDRAS